MLDIALFLAWSIPFVPLFLLMQREIRLKEGWFLVIKGPVFYLAFLVPYFIFAPQLLMGRIDNEQAFMFLITWPFVFWLMASIASSIIIASINTRQKK